MPPAAVFAAVVVVVVVVFALVLFAEVLLAASGATRAEAVPAPSEAPKATSAMVQIPATVRRDRGVLRPARVFPAPLSFSMDLSPCAVPRAAGSAAVG